MENIGKDAMCIMFRDNGKCGVKDLSGIVLVPAIFDDVRFVFEERFKEWPVPVLQNGKFGLASTDGSGKLILECKYDYIAYKDGYYLIHQGNEKGIYAGNNLFFPIDFKRISRIKPYELLVYENDSYRYGFVFPSISLITEALYEHFIVRDGEPVKVYLNGDCGYLNKELKFTKDVKEAYLCF